MRPAYLKSTFGAVVLSLSGCGDDLHVATESDRFNAYFYYPRGGDPGGEAYLSGCETSLASATMRRAFGRMPGLRGL